jgi:Protein of unknown function (DUF1553)/Protein of unknown function (DUF1549)/Concanavalin A-like lectin/glucanases superfamily/Planctomycete cytochrome C
MHRIVVRLLLVLALSAAAARASLPARAIAATIDFSREVRPILADKCLRCHGPDDAARKADLRLDTEAGVRKAFAGGDLANSEAWQRIHSDDPDLHMPPADSGKALKPTEIDALRRWMDAGAAWSEHWAFARVRRPKLPAVQRKDWPRNDLDRFVLARLESEGLAPSPEAPRETLIRRLSFDLTGLPPTLAEIDDFARDGDPDAYEHVVDRLLHSPHYGERMALTWLDGARYADTNGYQNDFDRSMWPWRDWVIAAFNSRMPYDQFVVEQLAGDLLPHPSQSQRVATGFNRNHRTVTEAGSIDEEWRVENVIDRVETTGTVFLGLTVGCARCHDHKYDPITQREFYQLYSYFNNVNEVGVFTERSGNTAPIERLLSVEEKQKLDSLDQKLAAERKEYERLRGDLPRVVEAWRAARASATGAESPAPPVLAVPLSENVNATNAAGETVAGKEAAAGLPEFVDGPLGKTASFEGKQAIDFGQAVRIERDRAFSCVVWVRPAEGGAIVSKMDDSQASRGFDVLVKPDGKLEVHVIHAWPKDAIKLVSKDPLPRDVWSHVAVTYDGSSHAAGVTIYVNGEKTPSEPAADALSGSIETDQPLRIGMRSNSLHFKGRLRDLRFYDRGLAQGEVMAALHSLLATPSVSEALSDSAKRAELERLYENLPGTDLHKRKRAVQSLEREKKQLVDAAPTVMVMKDLPKPREAFVLTRGRYDMPDRKQPVQPNVPAFLPHLPEGSPPNRLTLARWIVSPENPLTARVIVNRLWAQFFGTGLVATTENFGVQADPPSNPALLDWLADELVRRNWDLQAIQKLIVTSATYRQSSATSPELIARDAGNRLLARGPRNRLSAEMLRDNALAVSGLLSPKIGGPSVKPYQPEGVWVALGGAAQRKYKQDHGENLYRRGMYTYRRRTIPHPAMSTFDAPSWEICQVKRLTTNTPLQALALLNDTTYVEAARKLAERMLIEGGDTPNDRISFAFRLATARRPTDAELAALVAGLNRYKKAFGDDPAAAKELVKHGESPVSGKLDATELAAYTTVATLILNLDETITKE